jgi:broad specificity phosphatase PhoE
LERSLGQLEGLTLSDIKVKFPEIHRAWNEGGPRIPVPGEESRDAFLARTHGFLRDVRDRHPDGRILVVSHGGTINMLLMASLQLDVERPLPFTIENASINIVQFGERGARLRVLNDMCHLNHAIAPQLETRKNRADQKITAAEVS